MFFDSEGPYGLKNLRKKKNPKQQPMKHSMLTLNSEGRNGDLSTRGLNCSLIREVTVTAKSAENISFILQRSTSLA